MPNKNEKLNFNKMRSVFFFGLIIILGLAILYIVRPFFYPIFWAAIIAVLFYPVYCWLRKHFKSSSLSSFLTVSLVIIILFLPLSLLSTLIVNESIDLYQTVSQGNYIQKVSGVENWLQTTAIGPYIEKVKTEGIIYAADATKTISIFLFNNLKSITQNSLKFFFMLFIMLYALFYFLRDGKRILKRLMYLSPLGDKYEAMLYEKFTSTTRATLKGTLLVGLIQGTLGGILFLATGVEGAFIWGVVMVAFAIIPALGPFIIILPAGIIMLALGNIWQGVVILAVGLGFIGMIDNFIRPPLVGKDIQMHPLLVLFATLGGLLLFGISGFVIGPVIAALFIAIMSIYDHHYRNELSNN